MRSVTVFGEELQSGQFEETYQVNCEVTFDVYLARS